MNSQTPSSQPIVCIAIAQRVASLHQHVPNQRLLIALETSRRPLIAALAGYSELELYPVNPKQLSSYRDAGRPWRPDSVETRQIARLIERRRNLVGERKRLVSKLRSTLKLYVPLVLKLTSLKLHNRLILKLVRNRPTLPQLQPLIRERSAGSLHSTASLTRTVRPN